jgi:hypothetical protein
MERAKKSGVTADNAEHSSDWAQLSGLRELISLERRIN